MMRRRMIQAIETIETLLAAAVLCALLPAPVRAADVHIGINIGPPPVVLEAPPPLIVVPRSPVYYAPQLPYNYFYYSGRYYTLHDGAWFSSASFGGPWGFVSIGRVPRPILAVPVRYYRVPPGHGRKHRGGDHDRYDDDDDGDHDDHDHGRRGGRGHGHGHGHGHHDD